MNETTLNGGSADILSENIQKLKQIFPEVFCEESIDFEKLRAVLGEYSDDDAERYNFTWWGKSRALRLAQTPSMGTLRPCKEESKDWDTTENLYIEGDNLEVLKLLQKSYHGKIKMIYIDPPYNTGKDFVYKDDYKDPLKNYLEMTGQVDEGGKKMGTNSEASGRYHTNWLNMIYPRLRLARNLLRNNGIIFISISDIELMNLRKICDQIFGAENFIATLIWDRNHSAQAGIYKIYHEYVLVYSKNIAFISTPQSLNNELFEAGAMKKESGRHSLQEFKFPRGTRFAAPDGTELSGKWGGVEKVVLKEGRMISENGFLKEDIVLEAAFTQINQMRNYFYGDRENLEDSRGQKISEFYLNSNGKVKVVKKRSVETPQTTLKFGTQGTISNRLAQLFDLDSSPFDSPKPVEMIKDFMNRFTNPHELDIVIDFFGGSSTTAHSLFQINAEDGGNRKFILVQYPENLFERLKTAKSDGKKTIETALTYLEAKNLPPMINEIGKERIRRAGEKIKAKLREQQSKQPSMLLDDKTVNPDDLDIGFKVFKLDSSNLKKWNPDYEHVEASLLDAIENFAAGRGELDVVYEIMLKYGIDLTFPIEEFEVGGKKIYSIGCGALMICLDNDITTDVANEIVRLKEDLKPEVIRVVFKDNGFQNDSVKTNTKEILRNAGIDEIVSI